MLTYIVNKNNYINLKNQIGGCGNEKQTIPIEELRKAVPECIYGDLFNKVLFRYTGNKPFIFVIEISMHGRFTLPFIHSTTNFTINWDDCEEIKKNDEKYDEKYDDNYDEKLIHNNELGNNTDN